MAGKYTDRFSDASAELDRKNAYVCHTCGSMDVHRVDHDQGHGGHRGRSPNPNLQMARTREEKIIYSDPAPLGP